MVAGTEPGAVRRYLEALAAAGSADAAALVATVANKRSEKYDGYLTEELLGAGYGSREQWAGRAMDRIVIERRHRGRNTDDQPAEAPVSRALQRRGPLPPPDPFLPPDLTLPDIIRPGLDLIFVGINPSIYSAERGHYFARPSNRFWACLNQSGLVPERLGPADDVRLPEFGIGLTDIVKRATHDAAQVTRAEFEAGRTTLRQTLLAAAPSAICFVGKMAYQHFSGRRILPFGRQAETAGDAVIFVMPSTSGLVNNLHAERLRCLEEVRLFLGR